MANNLGIASLTAKAELMPHSFVSLQLTRIANSCPHPLPHSCGPKRVMSCCASSIRILKGTSPNLTSVQPILLPWPRALLYKAIYTNFPRRKKKTTTNLQKPPSHLPQFPITNKCPLTKRFHNHTSKLSKLGPRTYTHTHTHTHTIPKTRLYMPLLLTHTHTISQHTNNVYTHAPLFFFLGAQVPSPFRDEHFV